MKAALQMTLVSPTRLDAESIYTLTEVGERLRRMSTATLDEHFVRILSVIDGHTHIDVIRGWLRHYTNAQLSYWLGILETAGALTVQPAGSVLDSDFPDTFHAVEHYEAALTKTDVLRINAGARGASAALEARGAYLSEERLANRTSQKRSPSEIAVLVVEDDPDQAALVERRLGLSGYQVRVAETRRAFLAVLRNRGVPDIVFLDVELPDGDGFDVLTYVRRHRQLTLLPVIMLTAKREPEDIRKGLALGADGYLPKPYSKSLLTDTLRRVLKHA